MVLAEIQINYLDTDLRRYHAWDLDTHLCGVVLSDPGAAPPIPAALIGPVPPAAACIRQIGLDTRLGRYDHEVSRMLRVELD